MALIHDYDFVPRPTEPGLTTLPLCSEAVYLASSDIESDPHDAVASLTDCVERPWITAIPGTACHAMTIRACRAAGFTPKVRHHIDEFATVLALVAAGQGVSLVPELGAIHPPLGVRLTPMPIRRRTKIAHRAGSDAHPAVATVTNALRSAVPQLLDAEQ